MKNQEKYLKAFPLTDIKMTLHLEHRVVHASSATSRHRLMHLMQCCWFKWRPTPWKYSCYCNRKWGM